MIPAFALPEARPAGPARSGHLRRGPPGANPPQFPANCTLLACCRFGTHIKSARCMNGARADSRTGCADCRLGFDVGKQEREANLAGANLRRADLRGANLEKCDLRRASLGSADLRDAHLAGVVLDEANLQKAGFGRVPHSSPGIHADLPLM